MSHLSSQLKTAAFQSVVGLLWIGVALVFIGCPSQSALRIKKPKVRQSKPLASKKRPPDKRKSKRRTSKRSSSGPMAYRRRNLKRYKRSRFAYVSSNAYRFYMMGRLEARGGRHQQAIKAYKNALVYHPTSAYLHFSIAEAFKEMKKWKSAFFWAKKMLAMNSKNPMAHHLMGELYTITKKPKLAAKSYLTAIQHNPKLQKSYLALRVLWSKQYKKQNKLIQLFKKLIKVKPDDHKGYLVLAELNERLCKDERAIELFKLALNRKPSSLIALSRLGGILYRLQRWDGAIRMYQGLLDYRPDAWQFRLVLASSLIARNQKHDEALAEYQWRHVLQEASTEAAPQRTYRIAWEHLSRGSLQRALKWATKTKKLAPSLHQASILLGQIAFFQGRWDDAISIYKTIPLKVPSLYADAQARIVEVLLHRGDSKNAREYLKNAKAKLSFSVTHWIRLSQVVVERGNAKDRRNEDRFMTQLAKQHPKNRELMFHRAYIAFKRRRYVTATALLQRIVRKYPEYPAGLNFLGYLLAVQGKNLRKAARLVQRSLLLDPGNGYYLDSLGWIRFRQGKKTKALELFKQAHHLLPTDAAILYHLGRAQQSLLRFGLAIRHYQLARTYAPAWDLDRKIRKQLNRLTRRAARRPRK